MRKRIVKLDNGAIICTIIDSKGRTATGAAKPHEEDAGFASDLTGTTIAFLKAKQKRARNLLSANRIEINILESELVNLLNQRLVLEQNAYEIDTELTDFLEAKENLYASITRVKSK